ncbi:MAG: exonuclease domain-containing protein [Sodaliphilus pleomorphus]|jgi:DNA polymerase-3 subunit epsilon|uniref:exonuclease domain-containing protein n=1 Tax=Sodaliphilus pleomorphus TaxID=2606626 RepID=UPI0023F0EC00|nr:exonuclease domain-containing protein [Sodaliphilus pleomorphus]MDD7066073.1 exonuclease domain-containing protein [Sodaliphilus pleomorphus]MDY2833373.1 exonuclease domain-containing protein [Sodaliphilus pleomorphus]
MEDFAAIDFETANGQPSSVCSVGVVVVRGGVIVDESYSLICPEPDYYSWYNTRVHGLTKRDTAQAPAFPEVWAGIAPRIAGLTLVAHNKAFDERCLKAVFRTYGMDYPDYPFACTLAAARRKWKRGTVPNHSLDTIAQLCGFELKRHHNALADAEACAAIAMKIM